MIELVDTHCHIHTAQAQLDERDHTTKKWHDAGENDPDAMIVAAKDRGVSKFICVGTDVHDSQVAVDFVRGRKSCWASIGVHPHEAEAFLAAGGGEQFNSLLKNPSHDKIVAIGEAGEQVAGQVAVHGNR